MTAEYQTEIKKSDERWHANPVTKIWIGSSAVLLSGALFSPNCESTVTIAGSAIILALSGGLLLKIDSRLDSSSKKTGDVAQS
jgi:hypothetical protein